MCVAARTRAYVHQHINHIQPSPHIDARVITLDSHSFLI
jgi:hypothetical protein